MKILVSWLREFVDVSVPVRELADGLQSCGFEVAGIEYGRADFGIVKGRPQIYEINTNPEIKFGSNHPFPQRVESGRLSKANYFEALKAIDTEASPKLMPLSIRHADATLAEAARLSRNAEASRIDVSGRTPVASEAE